MSWDSPLAFMLMTGTGVMVALAAVRLPGPMRVPAGTYLIIISAMRATGTVAGLTHQAGLLVRGVVLVAGAAIAVARERFGTSMFSNKLIGLPAYYLGQTLIALSLATL